MTELQLPPSMPHAVPLDRPVNMFSSRPESRLPHPQLFSGQRAATDLPPTSQKRTASQFAQNFTPPSEMNSTITHGRALPHAQSDLASYGSRSQSQLHQSWHQKSNHGRGHTSSYTNGSANAIPSPNSQRSTASVQNQKESSQTSEGAVAPSLRIPKTIKTPQHGLPQLAAEVTCLFWFEDSSTLERIEASTNPSLNVSALVPDATPSVGFRKWVATILSTTQVTQNVILLALLFIYRLKKINPNVKGKPGSEFRLLTVALMLGNKFLDDNTYTNKTWAEVSGISVQEVHIMEVEFLSNMRYSLFTSEEEWLEWHVKLGKLGTYFYAASRLQETASRTSTLTTPVLQVPPTLPSPPTSNHASPPFGFMNSPQNVSRTNTPLLLPQISSTVVSPIGPLPELNLRPTPRKRSYDEEAEEPPLKRIHRNVTQPGYQPPVTASLQLPKPALHGPRLPLPALTIPAVSAPPPTQLSVPQLPLPSSRAMSTVYPPPVQWQQPASSAPSILPMQASAQALNNAAFHDNGSRQLSPYPLGSNNGSPISATFSQSNRLSPSYYLQQRSSPYRPVRHVHTLLVPPPSSSVNNAPRNVHYDQMQYQPLGKPINERRVGHLPYLHHEAWPPAHQFNQWPSVTHH